MKGREIKQVQCEKWVPVGGAQAYGTVKRGGYGRSVLHSCMRRKQNLLKMFSEEGEADKREKG
jgi:hypothetical protein